MDERMNEIADREGNEDNGTKEADENKAVNEAGDPVVEAAECDMNDEPAATEEQYQAAVEAIRGMELRTSEIRSLILQELNLSMIEELLEDITMAVGRDEAPALLQYLVQAIYNRFEKEFILRLDWLGERKLFELKCLCGFGESLEITDKLYEADVESFLEGINSEDRYVDPEDLFEEYPLALYLPHIIAFGEGRHRFCKGYGDTRSSQCGAHTEKQ